MDRARLAEWILSLVVPSDRAISAVGDWMEGAPERGNIWFWSCLFRVVLSRVWHDFAESPGLMLILGLRGWLYGAQLAVVMFVGVFLATVFVLFPIIISVGFLSSVGFFPRWIRWQPSWHPFVDTVGSIIAFAAVRWCEFQEGRWIALKAPGKELAACISACLTPTIFFFLLELVIMRLWGAEINRFLAKHPGDLAGVWTMFPSEIFLVAGALWIRRKSIRRLTQ